MFNERTAVGLDVHARSVTAEAVDGVTGEVVQARLGGSVGEVLDWVEGVRGARGPVAVAYEAGPTGFGLARALEAAGIRCVVAAPSKMVRPSGDRIKTDARDAALLVSLLRLDALPQVRVPTAAQEDARNLTRARDDARTDLLAARQRLSKLLLREGVVYPGKTTWTKVHHQWLWQLRKDGLQGAGVGLLAAFDAGYETCVQTLARRDRLDGQIEAMAADGEFTDVTRRLACLRGIAVLTAFSLAVEIGDWHRFTGRSISSFIGLVPSEYSSGSSRSLGPITRTGNGHVRRLLIEAAWNHRTVYQAGAGLRARWTTAPAHVVARTDAGNRRLHRRWVTMTGRKKNNSVINTAIARELASWCWSLAVMD